MARVGTPPPHGFSQAPFGSNRATSRPSAASRDARCAPAGPAPMIAISADRVCIEMKSLAMNARSYQERFRVQGSESEVCGFWFGFALELLVLVFVAKHQTRNHKPLNPEPRTHSAAFRIVRNTSRRINPLNGPITDQYKRNCHRLRTSRQRTLVSVASRVVLRLSSTREKFQTAFA